MDKEYEYLREEILSWQEKRFTLVSASVVLVMTALGFVSDGKNTWPWEVVSSIILAFLLCVCLLTWYFGTSNARLGAYIEVFYETDNQPYRWHKRNRLFKQDSFLYKFLNFNSCLALIYLVLGIASVVVPSKFEPPMNKFFLLADNFGFAISLHDRIGGWFFISKKTICSLLAESKGGGIRKRQN